MSKLELTISHLKKLLKQLDYDDIHFVSYHPEKHIAYFDGMLDTHYRIMCCEQVDGSVEVHDTSMDVDNYVFIASGRFIKHKWVVEFM